MRYAIEEYKLRGETMFRIVDTFNGGKVIDRGFRKDVYAITRRDELNQLHERATKAVRS